MLDSGEVERFEDNMIAQEFLMKMVMADTKKERKELWHEDR